MCVLVEWRRQLQSRLARHQIDIFEELIHRSPINLSIGTNLPEAKWLKTTWTLHQTLFQQLSEENGAPRRLSPPVVKSWIKCRKEREYLLLLALVLVFSPRLQVDDWLPEADKFTVRCWIACKTKLPDPCLGVAPNSPWWFVALDASVQLNDDPSQDAKK